MTLRAPADVPRRRAHAATAWDILFGVDVVVLALLGALSVYAALALDLTGQRTKADVWAQVTFSFLAFLVVPTAWVVATRVGGWRGALRFLSLDRFTARTLGEGLVVTVATIVAVLALALAYIAAFGEPDESPVAAGLADLLDPPLILALSFVAGFGEEVFFRGIVQGGLLRAFARRARPGLAWSRAASHAAPGAHGAARVTPIALEAAARAGPPGGATGGATGGAAAGGTGPRVSKGAAAAAVLIQGVLFGIAHAGYDAVLSVAIPLAIGIGFGAVYLWRRNLWVVIIAHTLYDLVALSLASLDVG